MFRNKLCPIFLILIIGCTKNNPKAHKDYQALRCEINNKNTYVNYVFNIKNGYLYFYDDIKKEFIQKSERFESGFFSENINEIFSFIHKNNLVVTNIEYYRDLNKDQKFIKKQNVINLKSLIIRKINKNEIGDYEVLRGNCIWIDPKLGIGYK